MNNNVSEQINSVINNLAEKLGVAADKVYPMLVKQSYISGIADIIWIIVSIVIISIFGRLLFKSIKNPITDKWNDWTGWQIGKTIITICILLIFVIVFSVCLNDGINALGNPEWYAIQNIINQIKQ
jgi:hypothetical protein